MPTKDLCYNRLVKIAENNLEHQRYLYNREDEVVVITEFTTTYGRPKVEADVAAAAAELLYWQAFSEAQRLEKVAAAQVEVDKLALLGNLMNAAVGTIIELDEQS